MFTSRSEVQKMSVIQIVYYCVAGAIAVAGFVFGIISKIKGGVWKKVAEGVSSLGDEFSKLAELVEKAESFTNYSGAEKLNYVLTNYKLDCINNGIKYDEAAVTEQIEKIIKLTKNVNTKSVNVIK